MATTFSRFPRFYPTLHFGFTSILGPLTPCAARVAMRLSWLVNDAVVNFSQTFQGSAILAVQVSTYNSSLIRVVWCDAIPWAYIASQHTLCQILLERFNPSGIQASTCRLTEQSRFYIRGSFITPRIKTKKLQLATNPEKICHVFTSEIYNHRLSTSLVRLEELPGGRNAACCSRISLFSTTLLAHTPLNPTYPYLKMAEYYS